MIPPNLEPAVRRILAALAPGETLTTRALAQLVSPDAGPELARDLVKLANAVPGLCTRHTTTGRTGYMKGKTMRVCTWHRIDSPDMPRGVQLAHMRQGDTSVGRGALASTGAASPGTSLLDRVQRLEQWAARTDPLFPVL